jgi:hypothetical protein
MCCIWPGPTINPGCRRGVRRRPCCAIMAIVADFDSYPQWNDEVKAVYALARYDVGLRGQRRLDTVIHGYRTMYIQVGRLPEEQSFSAGQISPTTLLTVDMSDLLAFGPYFPTKEVRINRGGCSFRYRLRQSRVGRAMTMDPLRRW